VKIFVMSVNYRFKEEAVYVAQITSGIGHIYRSIHTIPPDKPPIYIEQRSAAY